MNAHSLTIRSASDVRFDCTALGEVMLRLDPGESRIRTARTFQVWEGGGEYNVARGLSRVFGLRTAVATALADNEVGRLVEGFILQGGVDTSWISWLPFDGIGRSVRNGLNFTERGFGVRGAVGVSDRGHTAVASLQPGDIDWARLFAVEGSRWFHTGGIFASLSSTSAPVAMEAMKMARDSGTIISYDLNYRPSLWSSLGSGSAAQRMNQSIVELVDVLIGNEEEFTAALGMDVPGVSANLTNLETAGFRSMIESLVNRYPNLKVVATTLRGVNSASRNDWNAIAWSADSGFVEATPRQDMEILDRVGGGDSFASGFIYGLLAGEPLQQCVDLGAAHGALAMTTPGDTSMAALSEVAALARGGSARVRR